jgi:lysophospholipase L1-like esterase
MSEGIQPGARARRVGRAICLQLVIVVLALVALELVLRVVDLRYLRQDRSERSLLYSYDRELGWVPVPNSASKFTATRTMSVQHNSLGLRDIEHDSAPRPTILFLGDSFVWGYDVDADERFTELIRGKLPDHRIVNAGVSGYGTDQEYLLLQRLWDRVLPDVVVLICYVNDHDDNSTNSRYDGSFKPYFQLSPQGGKFAGQPVPKSRHHHFKDNWVASNFLLARLAASAYVRFRNPVVSVPDPTEHLIVNMRDFVEGRGAKFLIGLYLGSMEGFLQAQNIPFTSLDATAMLNELHFPGNGAHWTPAGHAVVADALMRFLSETGALDPMPVGGDPRRGDRAQR